MTHEVGNTIRIKRDDAQNAAVKAGDCGEILAVHEDEAATVLVCRVKGGVWYFTPNDVEVVDVDGLFTAATGDLRTNAALIQSCYAAMEGAVPPEMPAVEVANEEANVLVRYDEDDEDDEEEFDDEDEENEHSDCPDGPHTHMDDGEIIVLPDLTIMDATQDVLQALDARGLEQPGVDAIIRLIYAKSGRHMEAHINEAQARALAAFLIARFAGPVSE